MMKLKGLLVAATAVTSVTLVANPASAASMSCSASAQGSIVFGGSGASATCLSGLVNNDKLTTVDNKGVNDGNGFFGFTDWKFLGKDEGGGNFAGQFFTDFESEGSNSGNWDISQEVDSSWSDVMLVLKGGQSDNTSPNTFVGYNLAGNTSGTWTSPFINTKNGKAKNISHVSLYYRHGAGGSDPDAIPTPALLPGIIGMGIAAFRKRNGESAEADA